MLPEFYRELLKVFLFPSKHIWHSEKNVVTIVETPHNFTYHSLDFILQILKNSWISLIHFLFQISPINKNCIHSESPLPITTRMQQQLMSVHDQTMTQCPVALLPITHTVCMRLQSCLLQTILGSQCTNKNNLPRAHKNLNQSL